MNIINIGRENRRGKKVEENKNKPRKKFNRLSGTQSFNFDVFNIQFRAIAASHCFIIYCYHSAYII